MYPNTYLGKRLVIDLAACLVISTTIQILNTNYIAASSKSPYELGYDHGCDDAERIG